MRCFARLSSGFWLAGPRSGMGRRVLLGEVRAMRDAATAKQVLGESQEREGRGKTQALCRWGQHCRARAQQTMQGDNTRGTGISQSAHQEVLSHRLQALTVCDSRIKNLLGPGSG